MEQVLAGWEQYLFPPVSDDILLGDVLKDAEGKDDDPTLFRVVLTPSCDLVRTDGRESSEGKDDDPASFRGVLTPSCDA